MESITLWYQQLVEDLKENRFGVSVFVMMVQGTLIVPATIFSILSGPQSLFLIIVCGTLTFALVISILAIMPIRTILNLFIVSTIGHLALILISLLI